MVTTTHRPIVLSAALLAVALWLAGWSAVLAGPQRPPAQNGSANNRQATKIIAFARAVEGQIAAISFWSELAAGWTQVDPVQAQQAFNQAQLAMAGFLNDRVEAELIGLRQDTAFWEEKSRSVARVWADRADQDVTAIWPLIQLAEAWRPLNRERARNVLDLAVQLARRTKGQEERSFHFRMLAVLASEIEPGLAEGLIEAIRVPHLRSWGWTILGRRQARAGDSVSAQRYFNLAYEEAIRSPVPVDRFKGVLEAVRAWGELDPVAGEKLIPRVARLAIDLGERATTVQAFSLIGAAWGQIETRKAFDMADLIPLDFVEARTELFLGAAKAKKDEGDRRRLIEAAWRESAKLPGQVERQEAKGRVFLQMAATDVDRALEMLKDISPEMGLVRSEVLVEAVRITADRDLNQAARLAGNITDRWPRANAFCILARKTSGSAEALSFLTEAERAMNGEIYARLTAELALAWRPFSSEKAMKLAATIEPFSERARTMALLARELFNNGRQEESDRAWAAAQDVMNKEAPGRAKLMTWLELGRIWHQTSPDKAKKIYEKTYQEAVGSDEALSK